MTDPASVATAETRYCPTCGRTTAQAYCPEDGVATVSWTSFNKSSGAYRAGDVVAGRYRIEESLGHGGYGSVFAAVHTGTRQRVAVKMLDLDPREAGEIVLRRFYQEAQVTAGLCHLNTVRVFDVGQDEGGAFFIAMELIEGPTLAQVMRSAILAGRAIPERQAIEVCGAILRSLQEAHDQELVHRDLKPANIMFAQIAGETVVKVLDFGIARTLGSSLTGSGIAPGTPVYMSPEQCVGSGVDARSDIYAVGIMLYLCATGRLPFHSKNALEMMRMHRHEPVPDPRDRTSQPLSEGFSKVVLRALEKDPSRRFQTAAEMREALEAVQAALPDERPGEFPLLSLRQDSIEPASSTGPRGRREARVDDDQRTAAMPGKGRKASTSAPGGASTSVASASLSKEELPSAPASAPASGRAGLPIWALVMVLILGGALGSALGWSLAPRATLSQVALKTASNPCVCPPQPPHAPSASRELILQAQVAARIAGSDLPLDRRLAFAQEAVKLDPDSAEYRHLLVELQELARRLKKVDQPAPTPVKNKSPSEKRAARPEHPPKKKSRAAHSPIEGAVLTD